jgi:hypothetical protein
MVPIIHNFGAALDETAKGEIDVYFPTFFTNLEYSLSWCGRYAEAENLVLNFDFCRELNEDLKLFKNITKGESYGTFLVVHHTAPETYELDDMRQ